MAEEWPSEAIAADLAEVAKRLAALPANAGGHERGAAALAALVERYGSERGVEVYRLAVRVLAYLEEHREELRRLGVLVVDGVWRIEGRFVAELVRSL